MSNYDDVHIQVVGDVAAPVILLGFRDEDGELLGMAVSDREFLRALRALVEQVSRTHPGSRLGTVVVPAGDN